MTEKKKTIYALRVRMDDHSPWGEPEFYETRKERNDAERLNRCLGGLRTHAFDEKKTAEEIAEIFNS